MNTVALAIKALLEGMLLAFSVYLSAKGQGIED